MAICRMSLKACVLWALSTSFSMPGVHCLHGSLSHSKAAAACSRPLWHTDSCACHHRGNAFSHYGQPQQNVFVLFLQAHILLKSSSAPTLITMASTGTAPHLMKAVVIRSPGGPEVLKIERLPIPKPHSGQVLIRVKAFGLNRSELFTRQGHSPGVPFPRVLGIEAVGLVEEAPGKEFEKGATVATAMGGMGRQFDGGYAEYTCVPATQVQVGFSFIC